MQAATLVPHRARWLRLLATAVLGLALAGCETAELAFGRTVGPDPVLPSPEGGLIPTVDIAPAIGWPDGGEPTPAAGLAVNAFAGGLDHPRWLYVLPNADVLVAETSGPPQDVLTGFVADDVGNVVWRLAPR